MDWDRFNDQFREDEGERNARLRAAARKDPCRSLGCTYHFHPEQAACTRCGSPRQ